MNLPTPFLHPTPEPDVYEIHIDNTNKELFETCARAAEYYSIQRRERAGSKAALDFGGVIHEALVPRKLVMSGESTATFTEWTQQQQQIIIDFYANNPVGMDEWRTPDRAIEAICLYNKTYPIEAEPFKMIAGTVEMPFKIKLGEADLDTTVQTHTGPVFIKKVIIYWTGKMDGLVDYGSILVLDHKTTSVIGQQYYDDFVLSSQMHGYVWSARKLGHDAKGLLLDVLGLRKPSKSGTPNEFQRQRYFYTDEHLAEWEKDTFTLIVDFLEHWCRSYFPKSPKWCHGKYGKCQYWDVCTSLPEQRQGVLDSELYQPVTWSPLNK